MRVNNDRITFNGYKNIFHSDMRAGKYRFNVLALQLNNDCGHEDLNYFKKMLKKYNEPESDILTIVQTEDYTGTNIYVNNNHLLSANRLRLLKHPYIIDSFSDKFLEAVKDFNMKANTLLVSITERLMQNESAESDKDLKYTVLGVVETLVNNHYSDNLIQDVFLNAYTEKPSVSETAKDIHGYIIKNRNEYLEINESNH